MKHWMTIVGEDIVWPSYDQGDLENLLRYGDTGDVYLVRLRAADIVQAYRKLLDVSQARRNEICRAIREAQ